MVQVLVNLLKEQNTNKEALLGILFRVFSAVERKLEGQEAPKLQEIPLADDLWFEFAREEDDEVLWEDFDSNNSYYWQKNSFDTICDAEDLVRSLCSSENEKVKKLANHLWQAIGRHTYVMY